MRVYFLLISMTVPLYFIGFIVFRLYAIIPFAQNQLFGGQIFSPTMSCDFQHCTELIFFRTFPAYRIIWLYQVNGYINCHKACFALSAHSALFSYGLSQINILFHRRRRRKIRQKTQLTSMFITCLMPRGCPPLYLERMEKAKQTHINDFSVIWSDKGEEISLKVPCQ